MSTVHAWIIAMTLVLWTTIAPAAVLELITPPLGAHNLACFVLNIGGQSVDLTIDIVDSSSQVFASETHVLLPQTTEGVTTNISCLCHCRVTSDKAKKGNLRVTFCTRAADGSCQAAVTTE